MLQPYRGSDNSLSKQTPSQRPSRDLAFASDKQSMKPRSMSTNKKSDQIAPRFGGSSLFNDDMMSGPLSIMKEFQSMHNQMMSRFESVFDMEPFGGFSKSLMKPFDLHSEISNMMNFDRSTAALIQLNFSVFSSRSPNDGCRRCWKGDHSDLCFTDGTRAGWKTLQGTILLS